MRVIAVTPVIGAGAYGSADAVGGLLTFSKALIAPRFDGEIVGLTLVDRSASDAALALQLFDRTFTPTDDNDAYDPSDGDIANAIANIPIATTDYIGGASNSVASKALAIPIDALGEDLFGQLCLTAGTPTFGVGALTIKLMMRA